MMQTQPAPQQNDQSSSLDGFVEKLADPTFRQSLGKGVKLTGGFNIYGLGAVPLDGRPIPKQDSTTHSFTVQIYHPALTYFFSLTASRPTGTGSEYVNIICRKHSGYPTSRAIQSSHGHVTEEAALSAIKDLASHLHLP